MLSAKKKQKKFMRRNLEMFNVTKIFPLILIILDFGAGIVYACGGDIKKCIYWIAAAVLNICVTF